MKQFLERRLAELRDAIARAGMSGIILHQPAYIFHLTNWLPPTTAATLLVLGTKELVLVSSCLPDDVFAPWIDTMRCATVAPGELVSPFVNVLAVLQPALRQADLLGHPTGAVLATLPAVYALPLSQQVDLRDASDMLYGATAIKDQAAHQAIRQRVTMLDRGFAAAAEIIRPGVSELQVYSAIYGTVATALGAPFVLDCTIGAGSRTLADEPQPTDKQLALGDAVLIDLFPNLGGYVADYTRNFIVGQPTAAQQAQHAALEQALAAAEAALQPGVGASHIDQIVRRAIVDAGFGAYCYRHHTGHGFGLLAPEPPWFVPSNHTALRAGMVIAIEPGIYHPVNGGMRLEGNYIITDDGCESLAGYPAILTVCRSC